MSSNSLMKESEIKAWIQRRLGAPLLKVPLSDEQFADAIHEAKRWFAARKGVERNFVLQTIAGQTTYDMPDDCDQIIDVSFTDYRGDIMAPFSPFVFGEAGAIPYGPLGAPSSGGLYSSFVQSMQYTEMARRIIGSDPSYIYFQYEKKLMLLPANRCGGGVFIEYKSTINTIEQLPERDHDLIRRFALAYAMRDLGQMLSRYPSMPGAEGQTSLNGPQLLAQAEKEFDKLDEEAAASSMPMPWVTG